MDVACNTRLEKTKVMSKAGTSDSFPCLGVFLVQLELAVPSIWDEVE